MSVLKCLLAILRDEVLSRCRGNPLSCSLSPFDHLPYLQDMSAVVGRLACEYCIALLWLAAR